MHLSLSTVHACTFASALHELQLHHMWLLTLFVHGARSLQFLLFAATTIFFFIPKLIWKRMKILIRASTCKMMLGSFA